MCDRPDHDELNIRRVAPGDESFWRAAVEAVISPDERDNELISTQQAKAALNDDRCYMIAAEADSAPIGLLTAYRFPDLEAGGEIVYLYDIEVLSEYRNRAIGEKLLRCLLSFCEEDDVDIVWAGTDVENHPARALFTKTGASLEGSSYAEYEWSVD